jgi:hypothetical protein
VTFLFSCIWFLTTLIYILAHSLSNKTIPLLLLLLPPKRGSPKSQRSQLIGFVNEFAKHGQSHNAILSCPTTLTVVARPAGFTLYTCKALTKSPLDLPLSHATFCPLRLWSSLGCQNKHLYAQPLL